MTIPFEPRHETIARLNDELRHSVGVFVAAVPTAALGRTVITAGVNALPGATKARLFRAIREQKIDVHEGNDPYGERDFGSVIVDGERFCWKIDYYSRRHPGYGSDDPTNPDKTLRVLTIMRADEY